MTRDADRMVIGILARAADVPPESLARDTPLASLGFGSLDQIECVLALEDAFQVEISEADARAMRTVQDVIDTARKAVAERQPPTSR